MSDISIARSIFWFMVSLLFMLAKAHGRYERSMVNAQPVNPADMHVLERLPHVPAH